MKVAVLGSGGWGTALAMLLVENGHDVTLWSYQAEESRHLAETGENPLLPGVKLPQGLTYTSDLACVTGCAVVVMATPSFGVRSTAGQVKDLLAPDAILVSVSKGIEKGTSLRMTQIIREVTEDKWPVVALSGPSHAEEVARQVPTAVVSACPDQTAAEVVQDLFINDHFRVYSSSDVIGVESGRRPEERHRPLHRLLRPAWACGDNTKAMLMTRGLAETARLGTALGAKKDTFAGLAGMGDLIVTCTSMNSRNYRCGHFNWSGHPCPGGRSGRSGPWSRAITPWTPPGSWRPKWAWKCPSPWPPTMSCTETGTPERSCSPSCVGKNAMRSRKLGSKLHFFEKSAK